jgi:predicted RNA methylase
VVLDPCVGSGTIAVAAASEPASARVLAADVLPLWAERARENARYIFGRPDVSFGGSGAADAAAADGQGGRPRPPTGAVTFGRSGQGDRQLDLGNDGRSAGGVGAEEDDATEPMTRKPHVVEVGSADSARSGEGSDEAAEAVSARAARSGEGSDEAASARSTTATTPRGGTGGTTIAAEKLTIFAHDATAPYPPAVAHAARRVTLVVGNPPWGHHHGTREQGVAIVRSLLAQFPAASVGLFVGKVGTFIHTSTSHATREIKMRTRVRLFAHRITRGACR